LLASLQAGLTRLAQSIAFVGLAGLTLLAGFVLAEALSRWLLGFAFPGLGDVTRVTMPVIVTATFPAALMRGQHITIRFLGQSLGRGAGRWLDRFGGSLLLVVLGLLAWQLWVYARSAAANEDATWTLQLPLAPSYFLAAVLIGLSALAQVLLMARELLEAHDHS
jgi:TRAP-type C4-dicarboxylate transport system permease small subunit